MAGLTPNSASTYSLDNREDSLIADLRLALPGEAAAIAAIQRRAWEQTLPGVATSLQRSITLAEMTDA